MSTTTAEKSAPTANGTIATRKPAAPLATYNRWNIWDEFSDVRRQMDDLFGRAFGYNLPAFPLPSPVPAIPSLESAYDFEPPIDLREFEDKFEMIATLPGYTQSEIKVEATVDTITLQGERKVATEPKGIAHRRSGFTASNRFYVTLTLPVPVQPESVTATLQHGFLTLVLPKTEQARTNVVSVPIKG